MTHRLALVVDDSSTARITLKRMLEKQNINADTVDSAQKAIDYLVENTPNVIFMDHMMPGMDGLQAVEVIKNNPETATIPIMMYTSKEGDLYVSQARALGAVGILPKKVEPAELYQVLNKLGLIEERRSAIDRNRQARTIQPLLHYASNSTSRNNRPPSNPACYITAWPGQSTRAVLTISMRKPTVTGVSPLSMN